MYTSKRELKQLSVSFNIEVLHNTGTFHNSYNFWISFDTLHFGDLCMTFNSQHHNGTNGMWYVSAYSDDHDSFLKCKIDIVFMFHMCTAYQLNKMWAIH